ncbi:MAG: GNAT family N-acyltransferase [Pseudomonadota bacterium]
MSAPIDPAGVDSYPRHRDAMPPTRQRSGRYTLRFAQDQHDLDRITKLRFEVFNLEIGEGLRSAWERCRDEDEFDPHCHHLMVTTGADKQGEEEVVGTYRMQTFAMAHSGRGFYSDDEFDLSALEPILPQAVELGRACIAREHRNQRVLFLLWRGLAAYVSANDMRYFFGCCSLTGQDPVEANKVHEHLIETGSQHADWQAPTRPAYRVPTVSKQAPAARDGAVEIPPLMQLYLDYGARIVSPPAIDSRFNTIDFLALFDVASLNQRVRRMFFE